MNQSKVTIYAIDVRQLERDDIYQKYYQQMPNSRKGKLDALRQDADRRRSLGAGILLKRELLQYNIAWNDENVIEEAQGKLRLKDGEVQFNLSHSGNYAVAAFTEMEVGVDIEQCGQANMKITKRFFHEKEQAILAQARTREEQDQMFFRLWTLKESFLKVNGEGMRLPMNSFAIHLENEKRTVEEDVLTGHYEFAEYAIEDNSNEQYRIAVCAKKKTSDQSVNFASEIQYVEVKDEELDR